MYKKPKHYAENIPRPHAKGCDMRGITNRANGLCPKFVTWQPRASCPCHPYMVSFFPLHPLPASYCSSGKTQPRQVKSPVASQSPPPQELDSVIRNTSSVALSEHVTSSWLNSLMFFLSSENLSAQEARKLQCDRLSRCSGKGFKKLWRDFINNYTIIFYLV